MKYRALFLLLAFASCAPQKLSRADYLKIPVERFESINEAVSTYRAGLRNLMATIPEHTDPSNPLYPLAQHKYSVYNNLGWSYIRADNTLVSLTSGNLDGYWVSFLDLNHPALETRHATLSSTKNNDLVVAIVRPHRVSVKWAGIFLVHEFSHLKDYKEFGYADREDGEFRAYTLEKLAVNHLTSNRFDRALDYVIKKSALTDVSGLIDIHVNRPETFTPLFREIDNAIGEEQSQTRVEAEMKYGFYLVAIALRLCEQRGDTPATATKKINALLKSTSLF